MGGYRLPNAPNDSNKEGATLNLISRSIASGVLRKKYRTPPLPPAKAAQSPSGISVRRNIETKLLKYPMPAITPRTWTGHLEGRQMALAQYTTCQESVT